MPSSEEAMRKVFFRILLPVAAVAIFGLFVVRPYLARHFVPWIGNSKDWSDPLSAAAANADRIVVRDVGFHEGKLQPDCEIRGSEKIQELLGLIDIDAANSGFHCMCDGNYWIHVYKGNEEVLILGYHHGRSLRWHGGTWHGDALLTGTSQEAVPAWFKQNGCAYLQEVRDQELARLNEQLEENSRFAGFFPEEVRALLLERDDSGPGGDGDVNLGRKIAHQMADGEAVTVAVCKALGSVKMTWTTTGEKERRALAAVHTVSGPEFLRGLEQLRDDPQGLCGAARVFFREGYHVKIPAEVRTPWVSRLAEAVLSRGLDEDKPSLLRFLWKERDPGTQSLLQDVFHGKVGTEIDLDQAFGQEPGLRTGAALALAVRGDQSIKHEVELQRSNVKSKADEAALDVCLALMGDPTRLKAEHLRLQSYSIGLAGLTVIDRDDGKHTMEALVKGGIHHPWGYVNDEARRIFERITGRKMTNAEIENWWDAEKDKGP
jgi:hypothetical protein